MQIATQTLEKHIQVISTDLMEALKESAEARGLSLDAEIALRLTAYMAEPELADDNALSEQILRKQFTEAEAIAECKRKRQSAMYHYEIEKLRNFLRYEHLLPRNIKETYTVIDVKEETKQIKIELAEEEKRNNKGWGEM